MSQAHWIQQGQLQPQQQQQDPAPSSTTNAGSSSATQKKTVEDDEDEGDDNDCDLLHDDDCLERVARSLGRVWPVKPASQWCNVSTAPADSNNSNPPNSSHSGFGGGLLLTKVPKSASSTAAAVALRLHDRLRCRRPVRWQHGRASDLYQQRHPMHSLLVAPVRAPDARALSSVYFHTVSFHGRLRRRNSGSSHNNATLRGGDFGEDDLPADRFIVQRLAETPPNYVTDYVSLSPPPPPKDLLAAAGIRRTVRDVLARYDFLLVAERLNESLVVLAWLTMPELHDANNNNSNWNATLAHFVTLPSKLSGSWHASRGRCVRLVPAARTAGVDAHFQSPAWRERHAADRLLHAAAQASLEATAATMIGREKFAALLQDFAALQRSAAAACAAEARFPCRADGTLRPANETDCYQRDLGCGRECLDRVLLPRVLRQQQQESG